MTNFKSRAAVQNHYDTLALGEDFAGLVAAALCAQNGLRVLVGQPYHAITENYAIGPYILSRTPLPFALETSPAFRRVANALNLFHTIKRRLEPLHPSFQVLLPQARIDVDFDNDRLLREIDREFPSERAVVDNFLIHTNQIVERLDAQFGQDAAFPPQGFWARRRLHDLAHQLAAVPADLTPSLSQEHPLRAVLALPAAFMQYTDPRALSSIAMARAFELFRRGPARLQGGRAMLRQLFIEKILAHGSSELYPVVPDTIDLRWRKIRGMGLFGQSDGIGLTSLLGALPIAELGDIFGDAWPRRIMQLSRTIRPTAYRYVLHVVMDEAGVPEGMAPLLFAVFDPTQPLIGDNALAIYMSEPDAEARVIVSLIANAPPPGDGQNLDDVFAALRPRLRRRLEEIMPFSSHHIRLVHSPHQARLPEGLALPPSEKLPPPSAPPPLWTLTASARFPLGALPYHIGLRNVAMANAQNLPSLGLEGEFIAGASAAEAICRIVGKKV